MSDKSSRKLSKWRITAFNGGSLADPVNIVRQNGALKIVFWNDGKPTFMCLVCFMQMYWMENEADMERTLYLLLRFFVFFVKAPSENRSRKMLPSQVHPWNRRELLLDELSSPMSFISFINDSMMFKKPDFNACKPRAHVFHSIQKCTAGIYIL